MTGLESYSYEFTVRHKLGSKISAYSHSNVKPINVTKDYPFQIPAKSEVYTAPFLFESCKMGL